MLHGSKDGKDCFGLHSNPWLSLIVGRPLQAASVQVNAHTGDCRTGVTFGRLTFELTGPEQWDGICASVFASANAGTLCRVRLSDLLGHAVF